MKNMIIATIVALSLSACLFSKKEEGAMEENTTMEQEMPADGGDMGAPAEEAPADAAPAEEPAE